jgi:long-chain acyl-CoA synthetase
LLSKVLFRLEVSGVEELDKLEKPFLICPNHQSFIDPVIVCSAYPYSVLEDTFHVGASEYFKGFFTSRITNFLKIVPINADSQILKAMKAGAIGLKNGKVLNIYPEGERAFDGDLHPFKKGAAILATELDLPIVPVALDGLHKVWARESNKIRLAKVKVKFGKPFYTKDLIDSEMNDEEKYEAVTNELKRKIQTMIDEMRK